MPGEERAATRCRFKDSCNAVVSVNPGSRRSIPAATTKWSAFGPKERSCAATSNVALNTASTSNMRLTAS